jgi:hypothetical protein
VTKDVLQITHFQARTCLSHHDRMEPLRLALLRLVVGVQATEDLPFIAAYALVEGKDTQALRELAGTPRTEVRDARDLFLQAVVELGWTVPDENDARRALAHYWAEEMVEGRLDPYRASHLIWWEAWNYLHDGDLAIFVGLASEWRDHPSDRRDLERRMIDEARRLLCAPK